MASNYTVKTKNIVRKATEEAYMNKNGEEKFPWKQIGELKIIENMVDGSVFYKIKLNASSEEFDVFDQKKRDTEGKKEEGGETDKELKKVVRGEEENVVYPQGEIDPNDIPF